MFTTNEVAEILKVTRQTVCNWIESNKLKAIKTPGGDYRVSEEEVNRLKEGK